MHSSLDAEWKIVLAYLVQYIYISHKNKPIFKTAYQIMYVVWENIAIQNESQESLTLQSSYFKNEVRLTSGSNLERPFKAVNSIITRAWVTLQPSILLTTLQAASRVPPVASKSSTTKILLIPSGPLSLKSKALFWISMVACPYSKSQDLFVHSPGSLPFFLT